MGNNDANEEENDYTQACLVMFFLVFIVFVVVVFPGNNNKQTGQTRSLALILSQTAHDNLKNNRNFVPLFIENMLTPVQRWEKHSLCPTQLRDAKPRNLIFNASRNCSYCTSSTDTSKQLLPQLRERKRGLKVIDNSSLSICNALLLQMRCLSAHEEEK